MADLIVYQGGGKFSVNKELISFIANLIDQSNTKTVLVDDNQTPVLIEDLPSFMHDVKVCYSTASTKYYEKYKKMVSKRNVESIVAENSRIVLTCFSNDFKTGVCDKAVPFNRSS